MSSAVLPDMTLDELRSAYGQPGSRVVGEPISLEVVRLTEFPEGLLSGWFGDMVESVASATETPRELAAMLGLATIAAAVQKHFRVSPESGYCEPVNVWAIAALEPGNRKTAVIQAMAKPLIDWERREAERAELEIKRAEADRKNQEARISSLRSQYAKASGTELEDLRSEIQHLEETLPEVPTKPRVWCQDITPEKLGQVMAQHGERIAILSDEGGIFDILGGRYNGGIPNLDIFLQAHAGASVRVDRGTRKAVYLHEPALTMGLSPQPEVLRCLTATPGFRGRGLLARFLYALPTSRLGFRTLTSRPVPENVEHAYSSGISNLLDIAVPVDEYGAVQPYLLHLTPDALREWKDFQRTVECGMREGERFEHVTDWAGKLPGAALRIAGLLHCTESPKPWEQQIQADTMVRALDIAAILSEHALAAFDLMGADPSLEGARKVRRWIDRNRQSYFSARDCFKALKGSFKRMKDIEPVFDILLERNHIFELDREKGPGRPSRIFSVNPVIAEAWK